MLFLYISALMGAFVAGTYSLIHGAPKRKALGAFGFMLAIVGVVGTMSFNVDASYTGVASMAVPALRIILALCPFLGAFVATSAMATAKVDRLARMVA